MPNIKAEAEKGFASFLGAGLDTVVETFNMVMPDELLYRLEQSQKEARERDERRKAVVGVHFGGEVPQIKAHGGKAGTIWVLEHPDYCIDIRSPKTEWNITVRYSAAGLWQYGIDAMRKRMHAALLAECYPKAQDGKEWVQLSSVHVAFDFYSPKFSAEMKPEILSRFVCHASSKKRMNFKFRGTEGSAWGRADYLETVTVGSKKTIEVQIYDKGKEITEKSGKTWMFDVWEREGYHPPEDKKAKDVWRLELRFGKDFLDNRNVKSFEDFQRSMKQIIAEAVFTKRLTEVSEDSNRRRRGLHPLWAIAYRRAGAADKMLPIGKVITKTGDELFEVHLSQAAAALRNMNIIKDGDFDEQDVMIFAKKAIFHAVADAKRDIKVDKAKEKYRFLNTARA